MAAAENHVMADAAAPPVISRTSAKLAGARSVGTSTPSANFALQTSTGAEWRHNNCQPASAPPLLHLQAGQVVRLRHRDQGKIVVYSLCD